MSKSKKYLLPLVAGVLTLCLILGMFSGCAPAATTNSQQELPTSSPSLGEIFDPSGNPFVNRFSDEKDIRTATFVVAASNSVHRYDVDYRCSGANDHVQIQAALNRLPATGGHIFFLEGTYNLGAQVLRAIDDVKFMGCGQATLLNLDGVNPVITAGGQDGWLFTHFATDAGGVSIAAASESAIRSVWIAGVRTDDPTAVSIVPATLVVAASDSVDATRADIQCNGTADDVEINVALTTAAGGKVVLLEGNYQITANIVVPASTHLSGMGKGTILTTTDAVGITNMVVINGNNVTISDMKLVLGAGAGVGGSRPNAIYATGHTKLLLENLWIYGDKTVADDGSDLRQCGILWATVTDSKIIGCRSENHKRHGINLDPSCDNNEISGNYCTGCDRNGIRLDTSDNNAVTSNNCGANAFDGIYLTGSLHNTVSANICNGAGGTYSGILLSASEYNTVTANICRSNGGMGITVGASHNTITGNNCNNNTRCGIYTENADECTITENCCCGNGRQGINIDESDRSVVSGNTCSDNTWDGILVDYNCHDSVIIGNVCYGNDPGGNTYSGICLYLQNRVVVVGNECSDNGLHGIFVTFGNNDCLLAENLCYHQFTGDGIHIKGNAANPSNNNVIRDNSCLSNASDGIEIEGGADAAGSRVFDNRCSGNGGLCLNDGGANTILAVYVVPFSDGTDPQDSGYLIDANTETARAWLVLPLEVQVVIKLKIYARAVDASGTTMALEINVNGGASNEAYTTHATAAPNTPSTTTNFAADDVIFWELSSAQIVALNAGDSIQVVVLHEAANAGGIETDAYIRTVEIEYQ